MKASADSPLAPDANARAAAWLSPRLSGRPICGGGDGARGGDSGGGDGGGGNSGGGEASISEGEGGLVASSLPRLRWRRSQQRRSQQYPEAEAEAAPIITTEWLSQPAVRGAPMVSVSE